MNYISVTEYIPDNLTEAQEAEVTRLAMSSKYWSDAEVAVSWAVEVALQELGIETINGVAL